MNVYDVITIFLVIFILILALFMYLTKGRDRKLAISEVKKLPDGITPLNASFLLKGYATKKDTESMLLFLASKGYLKIVDLKDNKKISSKCDFKLVKLKDYDGNNIYEEKFMNGIFKFSSEITMLDIEENFYKVADNISKESTEDYSKKIVDSDVKKYRIILSILFFLIYFLINIPVFMFCDGNITFNISCTIPFELMVYIFIFTCINGGIKNKTFYKPSKKSITIAVIVYLILGNYSFLVCKDYSFGAVIYPYILGKIVMLMILILYSNFYRKSDYGKDMCSKILGYKMYLENNYVDNFYDKISYFYSFNISNILFDKYKNVKKPSWIETNENGIEFINYVMKEFNKIVYKDIYNFGNELVDSIMK